MKKIFRFTTNLIITTIALSLLASCEHKDLCYQHPHSKKIIVNFDWQYAPTANPGEMCAYFYPTNGEEVRRFNFIGKNGGEINLNIGTYNVIVYNCDTEAIQIVDAEDFYSHAFTTREGGIFESVLGRTEYDAPRAEGTEDERVLITPDMIWGCAVTQLEVTDKGIFYTPIEENKGEYTTPQLTIESRSDVVLTFYPKEQVCNYSYEIRNVENLKHYVRMCASLSSMSGKLYPGTQELSTEYITLPLESHIADENKIIGSFYTFGHHSELDRHHNFHLYIWDTNGAGYCRIIDVSDQIHNAPDKRKVHIIIDGKNLDLPIPITNGGGFNPAVDGWFEENHDINMGT